MYDYETIIFDCDGVVLDSNRIKTDAFYAAARPFGATAAEALVAHHIVHGGVSRYAKFAYFLEEIVPKYATTTPCVIGNQVMDNLLGTYGAAVHQGLLTCGVAPGLFELRAATSHARWCVVSGGDQAELRDVFDARGLTGIFNGGIFGSPDTKDVILAREKANGNIRLPALFLGDSRFDHTAATVAGLDFVFVHGWTEVADWRDFVNENRIPVIHTVADLISLLSESNSGTPTLRRGQSVT